MLPLLTLEDLRLEATQFARVQSATPEGLLFGVTDGKAIGTFLEQKFTRTLLDRYTFQAGNSASGIDFPELSVDIKVTSIRQPQSSSPFRSARQKVYGLGYNLLIFVYAKQDDPATRTATLAITNTIFVEAARTGDFQTTRGLRYLLEQEGNLDDIMAFLLERNLPLDESGIQQLAKEIMTNPPAQGFLTISNALQWRLQYRRVIEKAGQESGIYLLDWRNDEP